MYLISLKENRLSTEVENHSLTSLKRDSWEVNLVSTNLDICESWSKRFVVSPKRNFLFIKIDKSADDVSSRPCFSIRQIILVPFLGFETIIGIRSNVIAYPSLGVKWRLNCGPSYFHLSACFQLNLEVVFTWEHSGVGSYRCNTTCCLHIKIVLPWEYNISISILLIQLHLFRSDSTDFLTAINIRDILTIWSWFLFFFEFTLFLTKSPTILIFSFQIHRPQILIISKWWAHHAAIRSLPVVISAVR